MESPANQEKPSLWLSIQNKGGFKVKLKQKNKKSASKRFKITGTGKVLYQKSGKRHLLEHKSPVNKRNKNKPGQVTGSDIDKIHEMLPYFG